MPGHGWAPVARCWWSFPFQPSCGRPPAALNGLSRAPRPLFQAVWLAAAAVALLAWLLEARGKRVAAVLAVAAGAAVGIACVKTAATPQLERHVSARGLWREIGGRAGEVCIGNVKRD